MNNAKTKSLISTNRLPKTNSKNIIKYLLFFICMLTMSFAKISEMKPFALAFFVALVICNQNVIPLTLMYIVCGVASSLELAALIHILPSACVVAVIKLIYFKLKKNIPAYFIPIYIFLSQIAYLAYFENSYSIYEMINKIICIVISIISCYAFINGMRAILHRGLKFRTTIDEIVSLGIMFLVLMIGISSIKFVSFDVSFSIKALCVLFAIGFLGIGGGTIVASIAGFSEIIYNANQTYFIAFVTFAIVCGIFKNLPPYVGAVAVCLIDLILGYYFLIYGEYTYFNIIAICSPCLIYAFFPKKFFALAENIFGTSNNKTLSRYVINKNKKDISKKLYELSDIFKEMESMYMKLVSGGVEKDIAISKIILELKTEHCENCGECQRCWVKFKETISRCFSDMVSNGISRGKVTLIDIDEFFVSKCVKVNSIMMKANQLVSIYKQNQIVLSNMDSSKIMVAKQMSAVSKIMSNLAQSTSEQVLYNIRLEKAIIDELAFNNIVCNETIICGDSDASFKISLVLLEKDAFNNDISKIVSNVCGKKMMVISRDNWNLKQWIVIELKRAPIFDVVFGASGVKKNGSEMSGDTHSLIRISEDKFMLCLCDGMGSGKNAERISNTTISLIENFYKASFASDVILNSVNKLLSYASDDAFSAIDICVMDLNTAESTFIKIGSCEGLIKTDNQVSVIEGSSLPLGILEEIEPWTDTLQLKCGDMIILNSDGVREAFSSMALYSEFVASLNILNPQSMADHIIMEANKRQKMKPSDDMTVLVCKIFAKS